VAARLTSSDVLLAMLKGRAGTPRHVGSIRLKPLQPCSGAPTPRLSLVLGRIETDRAAGGAPRTILNPGSCRYDDFGNVSFLHFSDLAPWSALGPKAESTEDRVLAGLPTPWPNSWCDRERWSPAFRLRRSAPFGSVLQGPSNTRIASLAETSKCSRLGPFHGP
jgi:hypothetical protein